MTEFDWEAFAAATTAERDALCARLAAKLSQRLQDSERLHDAVSAAVSDLRKERHDLWMNSSMPVAVTW
jgi:hypothetical protein